jgi:hypothetical protein
MSDIVDVLETVNQCERKRTVDQVRPTSALRASYPRGNEVNSGCEEDQSNELSQDKSSIEVPDGRSTFIRDISVLLLL